MSPPDDQPRFSAALRGTPQQDRIVATLRAGIRDGSLAPGSRLPTRLQLQARFKVASLTMQSAIDRLTADGFVVARGPSGTFVVDHPPSSSHYGLVFPFPESGRTVQLWRALMGEAKALAASGGRHFSVFHGIDGRTDAPDYQRLVRDLRHGRLAGLVFAVNPFGVIGTPVLDHGPVPRIAIMDKPLVTAGSRLGCLVLDEPSFVARALDRFAERGRQRVAVISVPGMETHFRRLLLDGLASRGLATRPHWWHVVDQSTAVSARAIAHLLFHRGHGERPDALLVTDDNLVEHVVAGLEAAEARVPQEVEVVVHRNFPHRAAALPVCGLGYDARELLERALAWIDGRRAGQPVAESVVVQARFAQSRAQRAGGDDHG